MDNEDELETVRILFVSGSEWTLKMSNEGLEKLRDMVRAKVGDMFFQNDELLLNVDKIDGVERLK